MAKATVGGLAAITGWWSRPDERGLQPKVLLVADGGLQAFDFVWGDVLVGDVPGGYFGAEFRLEAAADAGRIVCLPEDAGYVLAYELTRDALRLEWERRGPGSRGEFLAGAWHRLQSTHVELLC